MTEGKPAFVTLFHANTYIRMNNGITRKDCIDEETPSHAAAMKLLTEIRVRQEEV